MDCGPSCLVMISKYYGKEITLPFIRENSFITKNGVSLLGISQAAQTIGFETVLAKLTLERLKNSETPLPCILHWTENHFIVLYKIKKNYFGNFYYYIADPAHGKIKISEENFKKGWLYEEKKGIAMFLSPTKKFYNQHINVEKNNIIYLLKYLHPFKKKIFIVFLGLLLGSLITLAFPFLAKNLVDKGISAKNLNLITLILISQLALLFSQSLIEILRNRILLFIGTKINIQIINDFLSKLMSMPLKYFDSKRTGDLTQRIQDHKRIEQFLTSQSVLTFFSLINFSIFFIVLAYYRYFVLVAYIFITLISIIWVLYFQKYRKVLDYNRFKLQAENQSSIFELITGMQEIKINGFENFKKNQWKAIQEELFHINLKVLKIDQLQLSGYSFFNNIKNIFISFIVAKSVISGDLTLGGMLSISYIIGEMNSPINQLIIFFRSLQDAKLSFSRLNEIHNNDMILKEKVLENIFEYPLEEGIEINNLSFQYEGPKSPYVLKDINLFIPKNKVTAIVGASGSGKTTLLKLLLKYYDPTQGVILVDQKNLMNFELEEWRESYGAVLQDGFIFSESIARNIATSDEVVNEKRLMQAIKIANLEDFIDSLPMGMKTKIGASGVGISGGQKQRILIARAVYKNPMFLFFDEATSSLDANNEKVIMENLNSFFKNRTVIIVAHRLSTVKNADQIIVLKNGKITERGNHNELIHRKNDYFHLVKNQLELGD